jgi:hypothetical protein
MVRVRGIGSAALPVIRRFSQSHIAHRDTSTGLGRSAVVAFGSRRGPGRWVTADLLVPAVMCELGNICGRPVDCESICETVLMTDPGQPGGPTQYDTQYNMDLVWATDAGAQAQVVNKALFAWDENQRDVVYMYLGHVAPPPWFSQKQAEEHAEAMHNKFPVQPQGAFLLSRRRAEELWEALGKHLGKRLPDASD